MKFYEVYLLLLMSALETYMHNFTNASIFLTGAFVCHAIRSSKEL